MGRRIFRNCLGHFMRRINNKGFTLTELMATVAIMVFVAAAFMGAILSISKNNVLSSDKLNFSVLEQNAMEEIKARPLSYLSSQVDYFAGQIPDYLEPYTPVATPDPALKDNGLSVSYRVDRIEPKTPPPETTLGISASDFDNTKYDLEFDVDKDNNGNYVQFNEKDVPSYYLTFQDSDSSNTKTNRCFLDISGSSSSYSYKFYCDTDPMIKSGNFAEANNTLNVKIQFKNQSADKFELHIKQDKALDKDVDFYVYDDDVSVPALVLVNDGDKQPFLNEFRNLSDQQPTGYYDSNLYQIKVVIKKNGQVVDTVVSDVKK